METMTCEQYVLAELEAALEAAQIENEELRKRIEELERFGLDLLKKRLLEYADKLDAENARKWMRMDLEMLDRDYNEGRGA